MVKQLGAFCQRVVLLCAVLMSGCVKRAVKDVLPPVDALAVWNRLDTRFVDVGPKGEIPAHPFFDLAHFGHPKDNSINFYPLTSPDSQFLYDLDLISGRRYRKNQLCPQRDVWEGFSRTITGPPYTEGVVPRLLDGVGLPQKIIVFGRPEHYKAMDWGASRSFRVRVVGGIIEQSCAHYPCDSVQNKWISRPVLVGVDTLDPDLTEVRDLEVLKSKVGWDYVLAYAQNAEGRLISSKGELPGTRWVREIGAAKALGYVLKKGHTFDFEELKNLRLKCAQLGDYLWTNAQKARKHTGDGGIGASKAREARELAKRLEGLNSNVIKQEDFEKLPEDMQGPGFAKFFMDFMKDREAEYALCMKYVPMGGPNKDADRFWFFAYINAVFNLKKLGYVYDCQHATWAPNPYRVDGERDFDFLRELRRCNLRQMDQAFEASVKRLTGLYQSDMEHYRFIEYDNGIGGTHQKIFSWVWGSGRVMGCVKGEKQLSKAEISVFPQDVLWKAYAPPKKSLSNKGRGDQDPGYIQ